MVGDEVFDIFLAEVEEAELVHHSSRPTLLARAVVGDDDEERVVEQVELDEEVHEPTDLSVRMVEEGREGLLEARREALMRLVEVGRLGQWMTSGSRTPPP